MQGPEYLYVFINSEKKSYYKDDSGMLQLSATIKPIEFAPDGWTNISLQNNRNQKYFALDRSLTIPLSFVEDGAFILKSLFYTYGVEADVSLLILKQELYFDTTHYGFYYGLHYEGEVDMTTFSHKGETVQVNIIEGGIPKLVKAKETVTKEIPLNDPAAIKLKLDGVELKSVTTYSILRNFPAQSLGEKQIIPFAKTSTEGNFFNLYFSDIVGDMVDLASNTITSDDPNTSKKFIMQANRDITLTVRVKGVIRGISGRAGNEWFAATGNSDGAANSTVSVGIINLDLVPLVAFPFNVSNTITLTKGQRLFIYRQSTSYNNNGFWTYGDETVIQIEALDRFETTYVKALRPKLVYDKLVENVLGESNKSESTLLSNYSNLVFTSGDGLRRIAEAKIKTTLSDFYTWSNSVLSTGMGVIGKKLRLESRLFWINYAGIIDLGEVKDLSIKPATDYLFNKLKIGYNAKVYEDVNGRNEFNNSYEFLSPITRLTKELNLLSPYRSDAYGIEFARINLENKQTTDSKSDNDVFVIHIDNTPIIDPVEGEVYVVSRELNAFATGIDQLSSLFNLWLSPKQNMFRNGPDLRSRFYKQDDKKLMFQTTEKNDKLVVSEPSARVVDENADEEISTLGPRLYYPILMEFETRVPDNMIEVLDDDPLKIFRFTYNGIEFKGIPIRVGAEDAKKDAQTFLLLSHYDNDLSQMIDIYE